ncbi:MAG: bifunctional methylenetetrahydrofolate dehydrogenase/methenyltetrahydrofolate cyclohydrolase FolD [Candidatus Obscuribacterales bacterium]|nr:bifunctional methylenetetrahydrofolate dehydrogenase/methenyltetrahydrofolate cyclohydrolase FolD [Candidatus Obscuribacterales bacterium]
MPETTTAEILDGKACAAETRNALKDKVAKHTGAGKRKPGLAVILVGDNPASELYVKNKINACKNVGIESFLHKFPENAKQEEVMACVKQLNESDTVDGILVQLPLPSHLDEAVVLDEIQPEKDADGLHPYNMGNLLAGKPGLRPCTPAGVMTLLGKYGVALEGVKATVIGRSNLVGKPVALMLMQKNATVTICHSKTKNLKEIVSETDVLIVAIGRSRFIPGNWIKPGAVVVDVGIHYEKGEGDKSVITGDVDYAGAVNIARLITPVPGGVGPMTVAQLLANTVYSYEKKLGLSS